MTDPDFDMDAAAKAHHEHLMGYSQSLEERRDRAREAMRILAPALDRLNEATIASHREAVR